MSDNINNFGFPDYFHYRESLTPLLNRSAAIFRNISQENIAKGLETSIEVLGSGLFRILVIGEFSRGKSTLINALLGEDILPSDYSPTTAIINEIKYGEEKRAVLHFRHPLPESRFTAADGAERHIMEHYPAPVPPLSIPYLQVNDYVVIGETTSENDEVLNSPFSKIEIFYPAELLKDGVEIFDSPGLNENTKRSFETMNRLNEVDGIVYLFAANQLGSLSEITTLESEVIARKFRRNFFVITYWDVVMSSQREKFRQNTYSRLSGYTDYNKDGIFFLVPPKVVEYRTSKGEYDQYVEDFEAFEKQLYSTLIKDAGQAKIDRALDHTRNELKRIDQLVNELLISYDQDFETTKQAYENTLPYLKAAKDGKALTLSQILNVRHNIRKLVATRLEMKMHDIADQILEWVDEITPEHRLKSLFGNNKELSKLISEEIENGVGERIGEVMAEWEEKELRPDLEAYATEIRTYIKSGQAQLAQQIGQIAQAFSGMTLTKEEQAETEVSVSNRLITGGLALLVGDVPLAIYGAQHGSRGIGPAILRQVGVGVALAIAGIANPLIWIAAAFGTSTLSSILTNEKRNKEYKKQIGVQIQEAFIQSIPKQKDKIAEDVFKRTQEVSDAVESNFNAEIKVQEDKVNFAYQLKQQGQEHVEAQRKVALEQVREKDFILSELKKLEKRSI